MKQSALFGWSLCLLWGFLSVSCVRQEYALNEIDLTVNVGGDSLALPLGTTDKIYAQTLLDNAGDGAQNFLKEMEDGTLAIFQAGEMIIEVPDVDVSDLTIQDFRGESEYGLTFGSEAQTAAKSPEFPDIPEGSINLYAPIEDDLPIETGLDDITPEIRRINFVALESGAMLRFTFEAPELRQHPDINMEMDVYVALPDYVRPDASVTLEANGELHILEPLQNGKLVHDMPLAGFDFSSMEITDNKLALTGDIIYHGKLNLVLEDPSQLVEWQGKTMTLHTNYEVTHLTPVRFEGLLDPQIDPVQETVAFDDLPDMLTGDDMIFDFYAPYLLLTVPTNIGFALQHELTVTPVVQGTPQTDKAATVQFELPARPDAKMDTTRYYFSNREPETLADGYTFVEFDLAGLLRKIPNGLQIELTTNVDQNTEIIYDFNQQYMASADYDFIVPMAFGPDLHLSLGDTLDGLPDLVNEILSKNELHIGGAVFNTMPVDLDLSVIALDANGREVPMETASQRISAGTRDGEPVVTPLDLALGDRTGAADKQPVKALALKFTMETGNETEGVPLKTTSWVQAVLKARIPGGITVDLKDLQTTDDGSSDENQQY